MQIFTFNSYLHDKRDKRGLKICYVLSTYEIETHHHRKQDDGSIFMLSYCFSAGIWNLVRDYWNMHGAKYTVIIFKSLSDDAKGSKLIKIDQVTQVIGFTST